MTEPEKMPGLRFVGWLELEDGTMLPEYMPEAPEGRPSINTPEGWKALVERMGWREN